MSKFCKKSHIKANGILVPVDEHKMHIYTQGSKNGKPVVVVMSGSGVAAPVYDYKVLYSKLTDTYRIAVIEKFGYGYSDVSGLPRDIEILVRQNREALILAGEKPPYILLPHSMSALEALHWVNSYPGEISAIIGLDMALPETYAPYNNRYRKVRFFRVMSMLGLHRIPFLNPVSERGLAADEIKQHRYLSHKNTLNSDVMAEIQTVDENARKVAQENSPDIPILLFSSRGFGNDRWLTCQREFTSRSDKYKLIELNCGHNIHYDEPELIAQEVKNFILWK